MLLALDIRNYLLVQSISLKLGEGLTVVTGETGAGKSIIVGAIDVLLGEKFPKDAIGPHGEKAVIEGVFSVHDRDFVESIVPDMDWDGARQELIIRRELNASGRTRSFVNDLPVAIDGILALRAGLADFHGQREHHSLFHASRQLGYLDALVGAGELAASVKKQCETRRILDRERKRITMELDQLKKDRALLTYQLEEIERLGLRAGEEDEIEARLKKLENAEKLTVECSRLATLLIDSEPSLVTLAGQARQAALALSRLDPEFTAISTELSDLASRVKDLAHETQIYLDKLPTDETELERLRERRSVLWELKRKHGVNVEQILSRASEMKSLLQHGETLEQQCEEIALKIGIVDRELVEQAGKLSARRHSGKVSFAERILAELKPLGFEAPRVEVQLLSTPEPLEGAQIGDSGIDQVEILFSANPGLKLAPLADVASGGETSRITLAVKSVLADVIEYPLLVYDEIDTGISGKTADAVGRAISRLSQRHQVLVITHLPQIAAQADHHLAVRKASDGRASETTARFLTQKERVDDIATLIAGVSITEKARASASELLKASGKVKAG